LKNTPRACYHRWSLLQDNTSGELCSTSLLGCRYDPNKKHSALLKALESNLTTECKDWLVTEMAENRLKSSMHRKKYSQGELAAALKSDAPLQRHWGSKQLLEHLKQNPAVLESVEEASTAVRIVHR
jgi:hypothetical protein